MRYVVDEIVKWNNIIERKSLIIIKIIDAFIFWFSGFIFENLFVDNFVYFYGIWVRLFIVVLIRIFKGLVDNLFNDVLIVNWLIMINLWSWILGSYKNWKYFLCIDMKKIFLRDI